MEKQKGVTVLQILFYGIFIALGVVISVNLVPPYLEHMSVKGALNDLSKQTEIKNQSPRKIQDFLLRRFQVNDVRNVKATDLEIDKRDGKMSLSLSYEVRVHLIGNIDAVLVFDDKVEVE